MTTAREVQVHSGSGVRDLLGRVRPWLSGRRIWWIAATLALAAGAALNWSWLVAIGIAPLLVAALPCVAMCALGLCMKRMMGRSCSTDAAAPDKASAKSEAPMPMLREFTKGNSSVGQMTAPRDQSENAPGGAESMGRGA